MRGAYNLKKLHFSKYRTFILAGGVLAITAAASGNIGTGTYCAVCPMGFLQITAASKNIPWGMLWGTAAGLAAVLILGRFFCGWLCTTTLTKKMFGNESSKPAPHGKADRYFRKFPLIAVAAALGLSFIVGFPVFCLICPIGIFFGFIFAVVKIFFTLEPSWNLIIFPAILALEILIFRRWCSYICPVSALFSLVSKIPFIRFRPAVNASTCISCQGGVCSRCVESCPEEIKVTDDDEGITEKCIGCMECIDNCPTGSLSYRKKSP